MLSFFGRKTIYESEIPEENQNEEETEMTEQTAHIGGAILTEAAKKVSIETVEELMDKFTNFEFLTTNPIDGQPLSVVRTEDVMRVLCDYFEVDGEDTTFRAYYTVK